MTEEKKEPTQAQEPKVEKDLEERLKGFNAELIPLLGKFELAIGSQAMFTPDGRVTSQPVIVSSRGQNKTKEDDSNLSKVE